MEANDTQCGFRVYKDEYIPLAPLWWIISSCFLFWLLNAMVFVLKHKLNCCKQKLELDRREKNDGYVNLKDEDGVDNNLNDDNLTYEERMEKVTDLQQAFLLFQYLLYIAYFVFLVATLPPSATGWQKYEWLYCHFLNTGFPMLLFWNAISHNFHFITALDIVLLPPFLTHLLPGILFAFIPLLVMVISLCVIYMLVTGFARCVTKFIRCSKNNEAIFQALAVKVTASISTLCFVVAV